MKLSFTAPVKNGHLPEWVRLEIVIALKQMEGKRVEIDIRPEKEYSSNPQRKYYFAVIVEKIRDLFFQFGTVMNKDEIHDWLMVNVGKWMQDIDIPGGKGTKRRSYMDLSISETEVHHTLCRKFAAENGMQIPEPNEMEIAS